MCLDKKLGWFDHEQATVAEQLVQQRWSETYKNTSQAEENGSQLNSSPVKVRHSLFLATFKSTL